MVSRVPDHDREHVPNTARGFADSYKYRQIRNREACPTLPGNIGSGKNFHNSWHGRSSRGVNRQNFGPRVRAQYRRRMKHPRNVHVIDERFITQGLVKALVARDGSSDTVSAASVGYDSTTAP